MWLQLLFVFSLILSTRNPSLGWFQSICWNLFSELPKHHPIWLAHRSYFCSQGMAQGPPRIEFLHPKMSRFGGICKFFSRLHPWKWNLKITCLKRKIIFQTTIFRFRVSFLEANFCVFIFPERLRWVFFTVKISASCPVHPTTCGEFTINDPLLSGSPPRWLATRSLGESWEQGGFFV